MCFASPPRPLRAADAPRAGSSAHPTRPAFRLRRARPRAGYSLIEMLMTILLVQLIGGLVTVQVSSATTSERVNYAGQELVSALRYARQLALSTGTPCGVIFDDVNQSITVFKGNTSTVAPNAVILGGRYIIDLKNQSNVAGVKISRISLAGGSNVKIVTYGLIGATSGMPRGLGSTPNNGAIQLSCGNTTRSVIIPDAGEPSLQ